MWHHNNIFNTVVELRTRDRPWKVIFKERAGKKGSEMEVIKKGLVWRAWTQLNCQEVAHCGSSDKPYHRTHLAKYIGLGQLFQLRPGLRQIAAAREILNFSENELLGWN
jgi:hypothetical protein